MVLTTKRQLHLEWRELGLAIVEVRDHQPQAVEQMQQNRGDLEVEVAKLDGQSCRGQAFDALGCLAGRQVVRSRTPVDYSHWNAFAER